ncbi:MAG: hypothetical protein ACREAA_10025 [Candidatus Polarisedimenticolia bacterium]
MQVEIWRPCRTRAGSAGWRGPFGGWWSRLLLGGGALAGEFRVDVTVNGATFTKPML